MGRFPAVEKEIVSEEKDKLVLDEKTLGRLLEAAYVMQERNRELHGMELGPSLKREQLKAEDRSAAPSAQDDDAGQARRPAANPDYAFTLAQIVETQQQTRVQLLELEPAMSLVAERLTQIARASGAAIGILEGKKVRYRAAAGLMTLPVGTDVPMDKALCLACLRTGEVLRCADVNPEFLLDTEECRRRGIQSLIAVPIFRDGSVVGGLELYYPNPQAFTDQDVHTCQLMAGLVTEALARDEEVTWKKSLATERAVMLEALEKLKPNLAALVDKSAARDSAPRTTAPATPASASIFSCRKCGHQLVGEEQFCGNCGTPRSSDYEPPSMQSKVASLWHMQEAMKKNSPADSAHSGPALHEPAANLDAAHSEKSLADSLEEEMPELFAVAGLPFDPATESEALDEAGMKVEFEDSVLSDLEIPPTNRLEYEDEHEGEGEGEDEAEVVAPQSTALAKPEHSTTWRSAASAREFLEQQLALAKQPGELTRFWNARRGDIYLAIAVILVVIVIGWGILSNHSVSATGSPPAAAAAHRKPGPEANLSLFDRMLIGLGLAEAPPAPEYRGNPNTQVWVDLHTALYYCPGADLYGKTPKGKLTSQRDAQLDQYEPAYRKTCD
jgi:GAF domain-containing protein